MVRLWAGVTDAPRGGEGGGSACRLGDSSPREGTAGAGRWAGTTRPIEGLKAQVGLGLAHGEEAEPRWGEARSGVGGLGLP